MLPEFLAVVGDDNDHRCWSILIDCGEQRRELVVQLGNQSIVQGNQMGDVGRVALVDTIPVFSADILPPPRRHCLSLGNDLPLVIGVEHRVVGGVGHVRAVHMIGVVEQEELIVGCVVPEPLFRHVLRARLIEIESPAEAVLPLDVSPAVESDVGVAVALEYPRKRGDTLVKHVDLFVSDRSCNFVDGRVQGSEDRHVRFSGCRRRGVSVEEDH